MKIFLSLAVALIIILALVLAVISSMPSQFYDNLFNKKNQKDK